MIIESKKSFFRTRYYNAGLGRFMSEDPIGFNSKDSNFYRFVLNNPTRYIDPLGLDTTGIGFMISGGLFGLGGSFDVQKVHDDEGNIKTVLTFCAGGVTEGIGLFAGAIQSSGDADTVDDLSGTSGSTGLGASVPGLPISPEVGGGVSVGKDKCGNKTTTSFSFEGATVGLSPVDIFASACTTIILD